MPKLTELLLEEHWIIIAGTAASAVDKAAVKGGEVDRVRGAVDGGVADLAMRGQAEGVGVELKPYVKQQKNNAATGRE